MKLQGNIILKGKFCIRHIRDGEILGEEEINNTVTATGKAEVAGLINEVTSIGFKWLAIGSSSTAATSANTVLAAEITSPSLKRVASTCTRVTTDDTNDTAQLVHTWTSTATQTVQEAGIFDSSSGGVMLARQTFTARNLAANDTLQVTYKVDVD